MQKTQSKTDCVFGFYEGKGFYARSSVKAKSKSFSQKE